MQEIIVPSIVITAILATIPGAVAFFIAWGKINAEMKAQRDDYEAHLLEAEKDAEDLSRVKLEHAVMRAEVQHIAARLAVGDRRLEEIGVLASGVAVMKEQLTGIKDELVEIKEELREGRE